MTLKYTSRDLIKTSGMDLYKTDALEKKLSEFLNKRASNNFNALSNQKKGISKKSSSGAVVSKKQTFNGSLDKFKRDYDKTVIIIFDVESDGPSTTHNNAFALSGTAIRVVDKRVLGRCVYHIKEEPGRYQDPDTMNFWDNHKKIYEMLHKDQIHGKIVADKMTEFINHFKNQYKILFCSDCAVYDWKWCDYIMTKYTYSNPIGYQGMDITSYASGMVKMPFDKAGEYIDKLTAQKVLNPDNIPHDHDPWNDSLQESSVIVDLIRHNYGLGVEYIKLDRSLKNRVTNENIYDWVSY